MPGLTAKVFRTYNASITLQEKLDEYTNAKSSVHDKMLSYNRANRAVAVLCNHQRSVPKGHETSMQNLQTKIDAKKKELKDLKHDIDATRSKKESEKLEKKRERVKDQLKRLKIQHTDRVRFFHLNNYEFSCYSSSFFFQDENKQIALGTSKLNYLDPRISVAWCKKNNVPIEKVFNKTQRQKFEWAINMADESFTW